MKYFFILSIASIFSFFGLVKNKEANTEALEERPAISEQLESMPEGIPFQLIEFTEPIVITRDAGM